MNVRRSLSRIRGAARAERDRISAEKEWAAMPATRRKPGPYEVILYFPDNVTNLYQVRQWYGPLRELDRQVRTVVLTRQVTAAAAIGSECPVDVEYLPAIEDVELFVADNNVKMFLYVNNNNRNMSMLRFADAVHVSICHGESDKSYMVSGVHNAFDFALIAGEAAARRLGKAFLHYDVQERTRQIGRPQLDCIQPPPIFVRSDDRKIIFYAPTWEGDRRSMRYGSLATHGERILRALTASDRYRLIVRVHPRSGVDQPEYRAAIARTRKLLQAANKADPGAGHIWDMTPHLDWQFGVADACISDISAVAVDWLATLKPMVITEPVEPEAQGMGGFLESMDLLKPADADRLPAILDEMLVGTDYQERMAPWAAHYFGDTAPGQQLRRWVDACIEIMRTRDKLDELRQERRSRSDGLTSARAH
ncbi:MAG: CDP-glycerol glycerophosphotransferase family protein [Candidatus Nanopelagicales bacterium]|nr:CDP-glycerol glycerophosphotransferase family protein [Candidatus Nanopelagicales bacterium]